MANYHHPFPTHAIINVSGFPLHLINRLFKQHANDSPNRQTPF
ncbi:hypothetical protein [Niallia sp. 01092]